MKYLLFTMLYLGMLFSCKNPESNPKVKENYDLSIQLTKELILLWESGDTLKTSTIFHKNCEYTDTANNYTFKGIEGVNKYVSHIHNWASDVKMEIRKLNVSEKMGYVEWTLTGKHTSPIAGRVPIATNKDIALNGVTLLEFDKQKIIKASDYMDVLGFVIQLGSKVELPGGVVIGEN